MRAAAGWACAWTLAVAGCLQFGSGAEALQVGPHVAGRWDADCGSGPLYMDEAKRHGPSAYFAFDGSAGWYGAYEFVNESPAQRSLTLHFLWPDSEPEDLTWTFSADWQTAGMDVGGHPCQARRVDDTTATEACRAYAEDEDVDPRFLCSLSYPR